MKKFGRRDIKNQGSLLPFSVFTVDTHTSVPFFKQLFEELRSAILTGRLKTGTRLPPTRKLAIDLEVSRNTVIAAYEQLLAEGYIESIGGSGTFVASMLPEEMLQSGAIHLRTS